MHVANGIATAHDGTIAFDKYIRFVSATGYRETLAYKDPMTRRATSAKQNRGDTLVGAVSYQFVGRCSSRRLRTYCVELLEIIRIYMNSEVRDATIPNILATERDTLQSGIPPSDSYVVGISRLLSRNAILPRWRIHERSRSTPIVHERLRKSERLGRTTELALFSLESSGRDFLAFWEIPNSSNPWYAYMCCIGTCTRRISSHEVVSSREPGNGNKNKRARSWLDTCWPTIDETVLRRLSVKTRQMEFDRTSIVRRTRHGYSFLVFDP